MMPVAENFKLKWNDFHENIGDAFRHMREQQDFFDVTLVCEDDQILAHKIILSACSPFFRSVLKRNPHTHPLLYLKGIKAADLQAIISFMYEGETDVAQDRLNSFLAVAEELSVKGLTEKQMNRSLDEAKKGRRESASPDYRKEPRAKRQKRHVRYQEKEEESEDDEVCELPVITEIVGSHRPPEEEGLEDRLEDTDTKLVDLPEDVAEISESLDNTYDYDGNYSLSGDNDASNQSKAEYTGMLEDAIKTNISKMVHGTYHCLLCDKVCRDLTRARQHLEAKHFPSVGYTCNICDKHCKTKHALTCHVSVYHRDIPKMGL